MDAWGVYIAARIGDGNVTRGERCGRSSFIRLNLRSNLYDDGHLLSYFDDPFDWGITFQVSNGRSSRVKVAGQRSDGGF